MKKLLTALALTLTFTTNASEENKGEVDVCNQISELAERYMTLRQDGVSMSKLYKTAKGNKLVEKMVVDAYEVPKFSTDEYREIQVSKFKNRWFLNCVKSR